MELLEMLTVLHCNVKSYLVDKVCVLTLQSFLK